MDIADLPLPRNQAAEEREAEAAFAASSGSAATKSKRLTDRLAAVEAIILADKNTKDLESTIVWRLFGVISFWARNEHERTASKARWLMSEIEDIVRDRAKRQNK